MERGLGFGFWGRGFLLGRVGGGVVGLWEWASRA